MTLYSEMSRPYMDDIHIETLINAAVYPSPFVVRALWDVARHGSNEEKHWAFKALEEVVFDSSGLYINE